MLRHRLIVAGVALFISASSLAAEGVSDLNAVKFNSKEFRAPDGAGGYKWNTPLGKVGRLAADPLYVRVAFSKGKVTFFDSGCYRNLLDSDSDGALDGLNVDFATANATCKETEGAGFHTLAEYYVDGQGFRFNDSTGAKVVLFPITYQFCAHRNGLSGEFKGNPLEEMLLCGVRFHFRSENEQQEQAIKDPAYRTAYDRTLNWLVDNYGPPEGFKREGTVIITDMDTVPVIQGKREVRFKKNMYWCRPKFEALVPTCDASIVLAFDSSTGKGQVIFLTPSVWAYAYAREFGGSPGDPLYRVLNGATVRFKHQDQCVDSYICAPPPPAKMPEKMLARFRLSKTQN
jgi:hypothetical protein